MSQQSKLLVSLGAALVLAAALGAYAYFGVFQKEQAELAAQENEGKLFDLDTEAISSLEVRAKGETTTLEKREGSWWIVAPLSVPADESAVRRLLDDLEQARHLRVVEEEGELRPFGLEPPSIRVEARTADGASAHVAVGLANTFDSSVYVSNRAGRVLTASNALKTAFEKTAFDLREKKLVLLKEDDIERFAIEGEHKVVLSRAEGEWTMLAPRDDRANAEEVDALLRKLVDFRAIDFPSREVADLGAPLATLTLTPREGEVRTLRFWEEEGKAFAQANGGDLAEIAASSLEPLKKDPEELRDRRIAPFDTETIARVEVRTEEEEFTLVREDGEWSITEWKLIAGDDADAKSLPAPARRWKVNAGLTNLARLEPQETLPASSAAEHGLESPARTVRVFDTAGAPVGVYHFGAEEKDHAFVRIEGMDGVYKVRARSIINVPRNLEEVEEPPEEG